MQGFPGNRAFNFDREIIWSVKLLFPIADSINSDLYDKELIVRMILVPDISCYHTCSFFGQHQGAERRTSLSRSSSSSSSSSSSLSSSSSYNLALPMPCPAAVITAVFPSTRPIPTLTNDFFPTLPKIVWISKIWSKTFPTFVLEHDAHCMSR